MAVQLETTFQLKRPGDFSSGKKDVSRSDMCYDPDFIIEKETDCSPLSFPSGWNQDVVVASQVLP